jgi:hypothetical protein
LRRQRHSTAPKLALGYAFALPPPEVAMAPLVAAAVPLTFGIGSVAIAVEHLVRVIQDATEREWLALA